ncbi:malto-oligosyltrehalose trehalohydrolase [Kineosporia sp. J2-2]|uniref:Malto-oligosyltrehalose trehalohydrolase n=1 Tax=Kineosporia corallincola TaxID=2835133 RepID=A0ABS5TDJ6_9ACTN|nr:malto-oligosyltrehalose trehalohydrolase [Kineosporia corallincola]MBT0769160.1 malto-oligosyltrehalose trehalohydrolase [Kineosporia corallincola]
MHEFTVWAPAASRVMLHLPAADPDGYRREPMRRVADPALGQEATPDTDGWWHLAVPEAGHGTDYAFALDGGDPRPDPRSAWQPEGVHRHSRVFDASRHAWGDAGWKGLDCRGAVFYELHIGTFTPEGTLDAAIGRLDHLVRLGVQMVELLPVAEFSGERGWGYDGVGLYAVHHAYGGPEALARFVDAAHGKGLGVCLDAVYNHLGPDGNYLREFGPYFTDAHTTPWGDAVNLDDDGSHGVRSWIIDNALRWFRDFHIDCLRLDAVHALVDASPRHLLAELSDRVAALSAQIGRPLGLVAESDLNDPSMVDPVVNGGRGMTGQWDDDVHHSIHAFITGETQGYYCDFGTSSVLARVLTEAFRHAGDYSTFRGKHWGAPVSPDRHRGHQFIIATQNHDQVGNRATGDRPSATVSPGRLAASAALMLTSIYTPMLFMGEEWGARTPWQFFTAFENPELAEAVRKGRRAEFGSHGWAPEEVPDPQALSTRDDSVLNWAEPEQEAHAAMLTWYRDLIALRSASPDLLDDSFDSVSVQYGDAWIAMRRGSFTTVLNIGAEPARVPVPAGSAARLTWGSVVLDDDEETALVSPDSVAVLQVRD